MTSWWETVDFYESPGIIPTVYFVIRCKDCGAEYETGTLQVVPLECPDCGKKSEVRDDRQPNDQETTIRSKGRLHHLQWMG